MRAFLIFGVVLLFGGAARGQDHKLTLDEKELLVLKAPPGSTIKLDSKDNMWENSLLVELAPKHSTIILPRSKSVYETELLETLADRWGHTVKIDLSSHSDDHAAKKKDVTPTNRTHVWFRHKRAPLTEMAVGP